MSTLPAGEVGSAGRAPGARGFVTARRVVELGRRTAVMGILNVTPDSFYDGGRHDDPGRALAHAEELLAGGADILDVGGESTRPGSDPVDAEEEAARVLPVIERLAARFDVPLSIDTSKATVARRAIDAGAEIVNDVSALGDPDMAEVVAGRGAALVLMHMRGTPATMRELAVYGDVVTEVRDELRERLERAVRSGIAEERILVDPGIGFAKTAAQSWELLARLGALAELGRPVLLGTSRKSFLGELPGASGPDERLEATCATVVAGVLGGADVVRVHDPAAVRPHLAVADRLRHGAAS